MPILLGTSLVKTGVRAVITISLRAGEGNEG